MLRTLTFCVIIAAGFSANACPPRRQVREPSLKDFRIEAQRAIGKPIRFTEGLEGKTEWGLTDVDTNPAEIVIIRKVGLSPGNRTAVTAHELGHVILMAKGFLTEWKFVSPYPTHLGEDAAEEVANCFIDPLADREAIQRGFDITALDEHLWNDALDAAKENV